MKTQTNALVLLKKGPVFSIATFFRKIFFKSKKEVKEKESMTEEILLEYQKQLETNQITTKEFSLAQIKALEKLYQRQNEEIEHQIKLLECRNQMCRFKIRVYQKEKEQNNKNKT